MEAKIILFIYSRTMNTRPSELKLSTFTANLTIVVPQSDFSLIALK